MKKGSDHIKIFCIGSNLESYECLKYLVQKGCIIHSLITLPKGENKQVSDYYDLHEFCETHGIATIDTTNVNAEATVKAVGEIAPDYLFTLGWSQIFREDFINCFSKFIVGTHPTKLPFGRGRAPLPWTIMEGLRESAVSFFKIDSGVDTGNLIMQRAFKIPERAYVQDLYDMVADQLGQGFYEIYEAITGNKEISFSVQTEEGVSVRGKRSPSDGLISFDSSVAEADSLIRAVSHPYPGAYCYYKDIKLIFWGVAINTEYNYSGTLGQILKKEGNAILVQFADGSLWLKGATDDNGSAIDPKFFRIGDKLGYQVQDQIYYLRKQLK